MTLLQTAHINQQVGAIVVRGISDLLDKKTENEEQHQKMAAQHASAFAFEILARFYP